MEVVLVLDGEGKKVRTSVFVVGFLVGGCVHISSPGEKVRGNLIFYCPQQNRRGEKSNGSKIAKESCEVGLP